MGSTIWPDKFVDNFLTKEGESVEEAKLRLASEQKGKRRVQRKRKNGNRNEGGVGGKSAEGRSIQIRSKKKGRA